MVSFCYEKYVSSFFTVILFAMYQVAILFSSLLISLNKIGKLGPDLRVELLSAKRKEDREVFSPSASF
jgi:hypothetical protein